MVDSGPYRLVRHPSYVGLLLYAIGAGALVGNWFGLAGFTLLMLIAVLNRIRVEELALEQALGDPYRAYEKTHKRLIPFVW